MNWKALSTSAAPTPTAASEWLTDVGPDHAAWSEGLNKQFGRDCAVAFAVGSDLMSDQVAEDLAALAQQPRGAHVGELDASWLHGSLPPQFVPRYDYEFVYALHCSIETLRQRFKYGNLVATRVLDEIALYLIFSETRSLSDLHPGSFVDDDWLQWLGDLLGDLDVEHMLMRSGSLLTPQISYHFDHWLEDQFWVEDGTPEQERTAELLGLLHPRSLQDDID